MIVKKGNRYVMEGPITLDNVGGLLADGITFDDDNTIVDLAAVTAVDSSALSLLLEWTRRCASSGRHIAFANMGSSLRSLAELYGVIELIPIAAD